MSQENKSEDCFGEAGLREYLEVLESSPYSQAWICDGVDQLAIQADEMSRIFILQVLLSTKSASTYYRVHTYSVYDKKVLIIADRVGPWDASLLLDMMKRINKHEANLPTRW